MESAREIWGYAAASVMAFEGQTRIWLAMVFLVGSFCSLGGVLAGDPQWYGVRPQALSSPLRDSDTSLTFFYSHVSCVCFSAMPTTLPLLFLIKRTLALLVDGTASPCHPLHWSPTRCFRFLCCLPCWFCTKGEVDNSQL